LLAACAGENGRRLLRNEEPGVAVRLFLGPYFRGDVHGLAARLCKPPCWAGAAKLLSARQDEGARHSVIFMFPAGARRVTTGGPFA